LASVLTPARVRPTAITHTAETGVSRQAALPFDFRRPFAAVQVDTRQVKGQTKDHKLCRWLIALAALIVVGAVCTIVSLTIARNASIEESNGPIDGLTVFAVFFVAALGIERLLEPLSNAILPTANHQRNVDTAKAEAGHAILALGAAQSDYEPLVNLASKFEADAIDTDQLRSELRSLAESETNCSQAVADALTEIETVNAPDEAKRREVILEKLREAANKPRRATEDKLLAAADSAEALSVRQLARTTTFWTLATCLGMVVAATMELYFLNTVGITAARPWLEILATGLIIGAGTKPLHDLVKLISAKPVEEATA
jgi:ABC-type nickel/cobalt efflux system permease component RcnA